MVAIRSHAEVCALSEALQVASASGLGSSVSSALVAGHGASSVDRLALLKDTVATGTWLKAL